MWSAWSSQRLDLVLGERQWAMGGVSQVWRQGCFESTQAGWDLIVAALDSIGSNRPVRILLTGALCPCHAIDWPKGLREPEDRALWLQSLWEGGGGARCFWVETDHILARPGAKLASSTSAELLDRLQSLFGRRMRDVRPLWSLALAAHGLAPRALASYFDGESLCTLVRDSSGRLSSAEALTVFQLEAALQWRARRLASLALQPGAVRMWRWGVPELGQAELGWKGITP